MSDAPLDVSWSSTTAAGSKIGWIERDNAFVGIDVGGGLVGFDDLDLEQLLPTLCSAADCVRNAGTKILPSDFKYCPDCGKPTAPMFSASNRLWSFPGPDGDGLLNAESVTIRRISEPIEGGLPAPDAYGLIFFVAGAPPRLMAADRNTSTVYVFNRRTRRWRSLVVAEHFDSDLPEWSWNVHAFADGFAMPGANGPIVAHLDAAGTDVEIKSLPEQGTRLASGPAGVDRYIVFLQRNSDNGLDVIGYNTRDRDWSMCVPVTNVPPKLSAEAAFATHVWKSPTLFWPGSGGYVALRVVRTGIEAEWRDWADGFRPRLAIRPVWTQQAFWQFGTIDDRLMFERLAFKGAHPLQEVFTTHLTAGECSFTSGMKRYAVPWDETTAQTLGRGDSFLMPICGFAGLGALVGDCGFDPTFNRVNPDELLQRDAPLKPAKLLVLQNEGLQLDLRRSIRLGSLTQLQCVVFDSQLLIYNRQSGMIEAWKIS